MRKLFIAVVSTIALQVAVADPFNPVKYDSQLYAEMVDSSDLIYCNKGICNYVDNGDLFTEFDMPPPDGYTIAFPKGKYSEHEIDKYRPLLTEFYQTLVALKTGDCTGPLSEQTKRTLKCIR